MPSQKVAVITGTSSGIGLQTAVEFAGNGYLVVATMREMQRSTRLEEAAQKGRGCAKNLTSDGSMSPTSLPSPV